MVEHIRKQSDYTDHVFAYKDREFAGCVLSLKREWFIKQRKKVGENLESIWMCFHLTNKKKIKKSWKLNS